MSIAIHHSETVDCTGQCVTALLRFAAPVDASEPFVDRSVRIHDARHHRTQLSLDRDGYNLIRHRSSVLNFYDPCEVNNVYYAEIEKIVMEITGAALVMVYTHSVRCAPKADEGSNGVLRPFKFIHNDYTVTSGPQRAREALGSTAGLLSDRRHCIINLWRPIRGPVEDSPLALCDAQSVSKPDLVSIPSQDPSGKFLRIYALAFNPSQEWSYFSMMEPDEILLFKTFESLDDGRARFTPHSAFTHPNTPPEALPRESIEVRAVALFE